MADDKNLIIKLQLDNKRLKAKLSESKKDLRKFKQGTDKAAKGMGGMEKAAATLGPAMAAAFSAAVVVEFGKKIFTVTAQFQKLGAVLENTLGSGFAAERSIQMITAFAAKTPFGVLELADAFVKLTNQGFKPTAKQMTFLGDLAASTGKSFDQLAEGILDAQTFQFERMKEFGIKASQQGDKIVFTFKGVKTEVDKTAEAVNNYILSLGKLEGVSGSMAAISKTLEGQVSNLGDSFDNLLASIGELDEGGLMGGAIEGMSKLLTVTSKWINLTKAMRSEAALMVAGLDDQSPKAVLKLYRAELKKLRVLEDQLENTSITNRLHGERVSLVAEQKALVQGLYKEYRGVTDESVKQAKAERDKAKAILKQKQARTDGPKNFGANSTVGGGNFFSSGLLMADPQFSKGISTSTEAMNDFINTSTQGFNKMAEGLGKVGDQWDSNENKFARGAQLIGIIQANMSQMVADGIKGNEDLGKSFLKMTTDIIMAALAQSIAKMYAAESIKGLPGLAIASIGAGVLGGVFSGLLSSFAEGGVTSGSGLAMVGDNPGGKEFIVPSQKLDSFINSQVGGKNGQLSAVVRGRDLHFVLERFKSSQRG